MYNVKHTFNICDIKTLHYSNKGILIWVTSRKKRGVQRRESWGRATLRGGANREIVLVKRGFWPNVVR